MITIDIDDDAEEFRAMLRIWENDRTYYSYSFCEWLDSKKIKYHDHDNEPFSYVDKIYFENEKELKAAIADIRRGYLRLDAATAFIEKAEK